MPSPLPNLAKAIRAAVADLDAQTKASWPMTRNALDSLLAAATSLDSIATDPPQDTPDEARLDFLDAVIADSDGQNIRLKDGRGGRIYISATGAVDVRTVLDHEMLAEHQEPTAEATTHGA